MQLKSKQKKEIEKKYVLKLMIKMIDNLHLNKMNKK